MKQQSLPAETEWQMNLGKAAIQRSCMYELLGKVVLFPDLALAESLLNGKLYSRAEEYVHWINSRSGIFHQPLAFFKNFIEKHHQTDPEILLAGLQEEYGRLFLDGDGCKLSFCETDYMQSVTEEEVVASIEKAFVKNEFASWNKMFPIDHITNQFEFLKYLCSKESEAWQEGRIPKAKFWRREEREFAVQHLKQWGERFFAKMEEKTEHEAYQAIASLGKTFMQLENGY